MNINTRMQDAYDQIAHEYTKQYGQADSVVVDWGLRLLNKAQPGTRILDVGCGSGQYMGWMESLGKEVVGIDLSAGMLAQARQKVQGALVQMDMRRLAFTDECFHEIACIASLLHLPKSEAPLALGEMRRVLVSGGALLLILQEGDEEGWEDHHYFGNVQRFYARYSQIEAEAMLESAGFTVFDKGRSESPPRVWLQFLVTKA